MAQSHTDDLRNVREGDSVEITTTEGETFEAECVEYTKQNADPRTGEVRETLIWIFDTPAGEAGATITHGLRSSPDDPEFPIYSELYHLDEGGNMGYIKELTIYGEMEA